MLTVTVALVGGGFPQLKPPYENQGADVLYRERAKVSLDVQPDEALAAVFERALSNFELEYTDEWLDMPEPASQVYFVAFYKEEDERVAMSDRRTYAHHLITVDEAGLAHWNVGLQHARCGDLVRAAEHGLVDGDPLRPYLILQPPAGNGILLTWAAVMTALSIAANIDGALGLLARIVHEAAARPVIGSARRFV